MTGTGRTLARSLRSVLLATAMLGGASAAGAQDVPPVTPEPSSTPNETVRRDDAEGSDVIVTARNYVPTSSVTASKSDIPLIETPQSVSVVTRDQIDLLNFINVQQAVRYTSGVVGENYGPDLRYDFLTLRGFTPKQYIDGLQAPITTTILNVGADIYGFESVDILKGPAAVLYGNTPPGGIYNLTSRRASPEFGGEIEGIYGTDEYKQLNATLTGEVADGVSARFTGMYVDRESQVDFVEAQRIFVAPTATVRIGPETSLTGLLYYQYDAVDGDTNGFLPAAGTRFDNPLGEVPRGRNLGEPDYNQYRRRQFAGGYEFKHGFANGIRFTSNAKWSDYKERQFVVYGAGLAPDNRTVFRFNFPYQEEVNSFAIDNRASAKFDLGPIRNDLLVGVDYRNVKNYALFGFGPASSIDLFDPVYNAAPIVTPPFGISFGFPAAPFNDQRVRQTGVYAQDQLKIGGLILTASGRYDWVNLRNRAADTTTKQDEFSYRLGASYLTEAGIAPYVSYATSFEPVLGTDGTTGNTFEPSTSNQIEAGVKWDARTLAPDVKLFATAAVYRIRQKNLVSIQSGVTPQFGSQVGEVEAKGAELEIVGRIREQLTFNGSYSYTDTEILESDVAAAVGNPLATIPKHKVSALVDYTFQSGALGGLGAGFGFRHLSRSAGSIIDAFNPTVIYSRPTTLFDAIIHYDMPGWRLAVNGSNILDKKYVARCASPANCIFGQKRQILASLTRKF